MNDPTIENYYQFLVENSMCVCFFFLYGTIDSVVVPLQKQSTNF